MQTIVGVVQAVEEATFGKDSKPLLTIIVESKEKGGDKYPETIAVKAFNDKAITAARNLAPGDVVVMDCKVTSKKSDKGFWNTDAVAVFIKNLERMTQNGCDIFKTTPF